MRARAFFNLASVKNSALAPILLGLGLLVEHSNPAWAEATLLFCNYYFYQVGTNRVREDRPIFLPDGVTRASGTNYIAELRAAERFLPQGMRLMSTTALLEGEHAGLFWGNRDQFSDQLGGIVVIPFITPCSQVFFMVRVWDKQTGTNFETDTLKASFSFDEITGGSCGGGVPPSDLFNFRSLSLGNSNCYINSTRLEFAPALQSDGEIAFFVRRSSPTGILILRRVGELCAVSEVWRKELRKRCQELDEGKVEAVPAEAAIAELRKSLA